MNNPSKSTDQNQLDDGASEPFPGYSESYLPGGLAQEENASCIFRGEADGEMFYNQQDSIRYAAILVPIIIFACVFWLYIPVHVTLTTEMKILAVCNFGNMETSHTL